MHAQAVYPQSTLSLLITDIFASRRITRRDQQVLMAIAAQGIPSVEDQNLFNRVYDALHQGLLRVVD